MTPFSPGDWQGLYAYLDGELGSTEHQAFEARLAADAALAAALEAEQNFRTGLRARITQTRAPHTLQARVQAALAEPVSSPSWWQRFSAWWSTPQPVRPVMGLVYTLIWLALLGGGMWWLSQASVSETPTLVELADIHTLYFEQNPALDVSGTPQEISDWFQDRLPFAVSIPALPDWTLVGARLGELHRRGTAHILFEHPNGQILSITLFVPRPSDFPGQAEVPFAGQNYFVSDNHQHRTIMWPSGKVGYAVVADVELPLDEMLSLAANIRRQLP